MADYKHVIRDLCTLPHMDKIGWEGKTSHGGD